MSDLNVAIVIAIAATFGFTVGMLLMANAWMKSEIQAIRSKRLVCGNDVYELVLVR